ncbi:GtrA family protein [Aminipila sp.]|uniref:GtrA family protein n=1 Tax=Aminipila sp. TaxID=2060095 RepID=UPI0028995C41|nr:GtrA family protein [Aminipila sp.]
MLKKHQIIKKYDNTFIRFLLVGAANTILGLLLMFFLYNLTKCGYWISSSVAYIITSIVSFFLNKKFTFKDTGKRVCKLIKFILNIVICYVLAYFVAKKFILLIFEQCDFVTNKEIIEQVSMILGMCIFTILNYIGQKFLVFSQK